MDNTYITNETIPTESCALCQESTDVLVTTPVTVRSYYVEGAGQLCKECYEKTYS